MCAHSASSEFALLLNYKDDTDLDTKLRSPIAALETIDADHKFSFQAGVRWNSQDFGFVTPNRFIPIFEKNGFIIEIDNYMLSHVARD